MSINQRIDQLEDEFDTVKQLLASAARYSESANQKADRNEDQILALQQSQSITESRLQEFIFQSQRIHIRLGEASEQYAGRLDRLDGVAAMLSRVQDQQSARLNQQQTIIEQQQTIIEQQQTIIEQQQTIIEQQRQEFEEFRRSITAAQEHTDRLLDYLLRQQGNNPSES